jgi:ABC-type oligopeptide transport system substrate-binding subunit
MWRQAGAQVRLVQLEPQVHYQLLRKRDFQCGWCGWAADYRDAKNFLFLFQTSSTDMNYGDYSSTKFDSLIDRSDREQDAARRQEIMQAAEQVLLDDAPLASVFFSTTPDLVSPQVKGWIPNNVNFNRTQFLSLDRSIPSV